MKQIMVPEFCLVVLIGASGSGKSTFAAKHFLPTEVLSPDFCRGLVADDEDAQEADRDAFAVLHYIAAKRLERGRLTVIDATNTQPDARKRFIALARQYYASPIAIVFDVPGRGSDGRDEPRTDHTSRNPTPNSPTWHNLQREGFHRVFVLRDEGDIATVSLTRTRMLPDKHEERGPFDIIGDIHGCFDELVLLLVQLGYEVDTENFRVEPPDGRKAIFLGDLVDRGPKIPQVLKLVMGMVDAGTALCIPGNHDDKLMRALKGRNVQVKHGLAESLAQLADESSAFRGQVLQFLESLVSHYVLDDGALVVAHAGMKENMIGREADRVRDFGLYGETTGETDEFGLPVRLNWAADYRGTALVVYGHTPVAEPKWLNGTVNIDTGCVFGGALTAMRYPEREFVSVPALATYAESARPFLRTVSSAE